MENPKSPQKSGRFDTSGSPVALFVAEISCALDGVKIVGYQRTDEQGVSRSRIAVASYKEQEDYLHGISHRPHIVQSISVTWEFFVGDLNPNIYGYNHI